MSLVGRLRGDAEDGDSIAVHQFWAAMREVHFGEVTVAQFKSFFNITGQDATELDQLIALYQAKSTDAEKLEFVDNLHSIFMLVESGSPGYQTNSEINQRLQRL